MKWKMKVRLGAFGDGEKAYSNAMMTNELPHMELPGAWDPPESSIAKEGYIIKTSQIYFLV